jgi:hypothetical protein
MFILFIFTDSVDYILLHTNYLVKVIVLFFFLYWSGLKAFFRILLIMCITRMPLFLF